MRARFAEGRRKGSEEGLELEDGPADGGSSKPKVSGCGAKIVRWGARTSEFGVAGTRSVYSSKDSRRRGTDDATLNSSIAAQADWEFCHWM